MRRRTQRVARKRGGSRDVSRGKTKKKEGTKVRSTDSPTRARCTRARRRETRMEEQERDDKGTERCSWDVRRRCRSPREVRSTWQWDRTWRRKGGTTGKKRWNANTTGRMRVTREAARNETDGKTCRLDTNPSHPNRHERHSTTIENPTRNGPMQRSCTTDHHGLRAGEQMITRVIGIDRTKNRNWAGTRLLGNGPHGYYTFHTVLGPPSWKMDRATKAYSQK